MLMLKNLKTVFNYLDQSRKRQAALLAVLMVFTGLVEVFSIGMLIPFLGVLLDPSQITSNQQVADLLIALHIDIVNTKGVVLWVTVFFVFGVLLSGLTRLGLLAYQTRFSQQLGGDISLAVYEKVLAQPYPYYLEVNSAEAVAAVFSKTTRIATHLILPLLILAGAIVNFLFILTMLLLVDWKISIGTAAILAFTYCALILKLKGCVRRCSSQISEGQSAILRNLKESLHGIRNLILDASQEQALAGFRSIDFKTRKAEGDVHIISVAPRYVIEAVGVSAIAFIAYFMVGLEGATSSLVILATLGLGAQKLLPLTQLAYTSWSTAKGAESMLLDVTSYLQLPSDQRRIPHDMSFKQSIKLESVCFRYKDDQENVLKSIDLVVNKGERIGIIGATGGGKSTLLDVLLGLLHPTQGRLVVDGVNIDVENVKAWQRLIGHVPQSLYLADRSIAENVATGIPRDEIDSSLVEDALRLAELSETVQALPDGVWTSVGEHGVRLSGGQRQRIGLARAFYKKAQILVIDEGTSALDTETEHAISTSLQNLDDRVTIITVAHRQGALQLCDRVLKLEDGALQEVFKKSPE